MSNVALAQEIEDGYDEISVEPSAEDADYLDVYVSEGEYWDTVPREVVAMLAHNSDVDVYDRRTGKQW